MQIKLLETIYIVVQLDSYSSCLLILNAWGNILSFNVLVVWDMKKIADHQKCYLAFGDVILPYAVQTRVNSKYYVMGWFAYKSMLGYPPFHRNIKHIHVCAYGSMNYLNI